VSTSAAQVRLQSMTHQTQVLRLAPAAEPIEATGPSGRQSMLIAALAGALLAALGAFLAELANRRVRSVQDLAMVTRLPVLASVPARTDPFAGFPALPMNGSRRLGLATHRSLG
jgi:succinoglycan biosynthesis transport protein ExoP